MTDPCPHITSLSKNVAAPRYALVLSHWGIPSEGMLQRLGGSNGHCVGQSTQNGVLGEAMLFCEVLVC